MKYREVLETIKNNYASNNLLVGAKKTRKKKNETEDFKWEKQLKFED